MKARRNKSALNMSPQPSEFLIRHDKVDLRIRLAPSDSLLLHEETIPDRVSELKEAFMRDSIVRDPVIVDNGSCVLLDGMHRVAALRELRCRYAPVCAVDYSDPSIRLGVWYRTLSGELDSDRLENALISSDVRLTRSQLDEKTVIESSVPAVLFPNEEGFQLTSESLRAFEIVKAVEQCARELRSKVEFETEHDALQKLAENRVGAVIAVPKITKATVLEAGLTKQLLPHKVTRHVVPARPLGVNVPLKTVADSTISLQEANGVFVDVLRRRTALRKPSGTIVEGRRYEEETFVFS